MGGIELGDQETYNLSLSEYENLKSLIGRVERLEEMAKKMNDESFIDLRKKIKDDNTLESLSKAVVESSVERKELREEINNMNNLIRTTLNDALNKMVDFSNTQSTSTLNDSLKDKEFLKKLITIFVTALITILLGALGIKSLIPM